MKIVQRLGGCLAVALLCVCNLAIASAAPSSADKTFVTKAAQAGLAEVAEGKLTLTKSQTAAVRNLAQRMVTDHSKANAQLASIARSESIDVPTAMSAGDDLAMAKLKLLAGPPFGLAYVNAQLTAHQQAILLFKEEISGGSDARVVAFAKATLPTLEHHLMLVKQALAAR